MTQSDEEIVAMLRECMGRSALPAPSSSSQSSLSGSSSSSQSSLSGSSSSRAGMPSFMPGRAGPPSQSQAGLSARRALMNYMQKRESRRAAGSSQSLRDSYDHYNLYGSQSGRYNAYKDYNAYKKDSHDYNRNYNQRRGAQGVHRAYDTYNTRWVSRGSKADYQDYARQRDQSQRQNHRYWNDY